MPAVPWQNGAGTTRALRSDVAAGWRVSVAAVPGPAPWSPMSGTRRWSCVVAGNGLALVVDGRAVAAPRGVVVSHPGDVPVHGTPVAGPVANLNLVLERGRASGRMRVRTVTGRLEWDPDVVALWVLAGSLSGEAPDGPAGPGRVLLPDGAGAVATAGTCTVVEVAVVEVAVVEVAVAVPRPAEETDVRTGGRR
ncbi:HutD family protein [Nocardioides sp. ChNu-99]|uniref:HutD family protein n=1 Tax=Nocardioides sp. ChNu-99 TaxID=2839897 RepID=UPI002407763D|nr:HutD family protein [Nocardioides sp. ChNu-99]